MKRRILKIALAVGIPLVLVAALFFLWQAGIFRMVTPSEEAYPVRGIDVSHHQGDIDWEALTAGQNLTFCFVKATEGADFTDPNYAANLAGSRANGLYSAPYHYFSATSSGEAQAKHFLSVIADAEFDLPPVLDFELELSRDANWDGLRREVSDFLTTVEEALGVMPILYTTNAGYNGYLCEDFETYRFWIRDLWAKPALFNNQSWTFWQYNDKGRLEGLSGDQPFIDLNVFNGDRKAFDTLFFSGRRP